MAKNRYIDTKFWDDGYITKLDPVEKLLFLYFLTNPLTNIAGIYEVSLRRIGLDTGIDEQTVDRIIKRFSKSKKIYYLEGYIIICNFPKHQDFDKSPKIKQGIELILAEIPQIVLEKIHTLSIPYQYPLNYSNYNSNTNNNTNTNSGDRKNKTNQLFEKFISLKGLSEKPRKEINAVFPRYVKVLNQILELTEYNVELAIEKMVKVATWAENNELDWSPETVIKKWLEIDDLPQDKKKKAYVDGDRAYQKGDKWYVILHSGEHKEYIGALNKIEWR